MTNTTDTRSASGPAVVVLCPYCNSPPQLVSGAERYPNHPEAHRRLFYVCTDCDASVGCHPGSRTPLGTLADAPLRKVRQIAHEALAKLTTERSLSRGEAYRWLADAMGRPPRDCHIAQFDLDLCAAASAAIDNKLNRDLPRPSA